MGVNYGLGISAGKAPTLKVSWRMYPLRWGSEQGVRNRGMEQGHGTGVWNRGTEQGWGIVV